MNDMSDSATRSWSSDAVSDPRAHREGQRGQRPPFEEIAPASGLARQALAHWNSLCGDTPIPQRRDLDPIDIPTLLPHSELIEVLSGPLDFRYRLIGDVIDQIASGYHAGMRLSEIPGQRPPSVVFALYAETVLRRRPVCARLPYDGKDPCIAHVDALIMPLTENRDVDLLWGIVVPVEGTAARG